MTTPTIGRLNISPQHQRRLSRIFQRQKAQMAEAGQLQARREMNVIATVAGTLRLTALPSLAGDVIGTLGATVAAKLQGIPVSTTDPTAGQVLTYDGTAWAPASIPSPTTRWEPVANGDPDDPQVVFDEFGDVVMEEVAI